MADPFATAAELEEYSQGAITEDDPRALPALEAASAIIRNYCGWHVWPVIEDDELVLDGIYGRTLSLPSLRVVDVTEVSVDGAVIEADTFTWSAIGEVRRSDQRWSWGYRSVDVTLTHGFEDVPEIKQLTLAIAARSLVAPVGGVVREQTLASSVTWAQTGAGVSGGVVLMGHEVSILSPYRIVTV